MSIFGAIQDSKLTQMMGSFDDDQGDWGRFLWALIPLKALRLPESDTKFQLAFLKSLFERIRALSPQKYRFAFDAQRLYEDFHWQLEQRRVAHPQRGMRAAIAKMEGYCARLALALHIIWELEAGRLEAPYIPRERVQQAIRLTEFFLSQVTLIHSEGAAALGEGGLTPRLSAILGKLKQFGSLTARQLQAAISWLRKVSPTKLRQDLMELAKLGYGTLVGQGNRLKLVWNQKTDVTADATADKTADSDDSLTPIDLREEQELNELTADTADTADIDSIEETSCIGSSEQVGANNSTLNQQYQLLSSYPQAPGKSSLSPADLVSAGISADARASAHNPDDDSPPGDSGKSHQNDDGVTTGEGREGQPFNTTIGYETQQITDEGCPSLPNLTSRDAIAVTSTNEPVTVQELAPMDEGIFDFGSASALGASDAGMDDSSDNPDSDPPGGSPVTPAYSPQGDNGGKSVTDVSATAIAGATGPSGNGSGELLATEEMADWHQRLFACQTLDDVMDFYTALDALSPEQRHQFESSVPEDTWASFWNLPSVQQKEPESVPEFLEPEPPEPESVPEKTLEQLKALLLACDSLVQLNELKRTHLKNIALAYSAMSEKEQATVDALAATAVPHRVFKYLGDEIRQGTSRLLRGMLLYLDRQTQVRATACFAPVWALNGVSSGWKEPVHVRGCLKS